MFPYIMSLKLWSTSVAMAALDGKMWAATFRILSSPYTALPVLQMIYSDASKMMYVFFRKHKVTGKEDATEHGGCKSFGRLGG